MKKIILLTLSFTLIILNTIMPVMGATYQPGFEVEAEAVFMANLDSDMIIYEKNSDTQIHPGYLAQLMTSIVALESGYDLDNTIVTMKNYTQDEVYVRNIELGGITLGGLIRDEEISLRNLLYAVNVRGANEAALMIADHIGDGSTEYFVEIMNQKAKDIGCTNTLFKSPTGLPDDSYTTAHDMYLIARYASEIPLLMEMSNLTYYDGGPTNKHDSLIWATTSRMIVPTDATYLPYIKNVKSSLSRHTGASAISIATKGGYSYLLVVMNSPSVDSEGKLLPVNVASTTTEKLFDWAYDTFKVKTMLEKGKSFGEIDMELCWDKDFIRLMSKDNFSALIPDEIDSSSIVFTTVLPDYVNAPVAKGDAVGYVELSLAGELIGRVELVSADEAAASPLLIQLDKLKQIYNTYWFKFGVILVVMLIISYIVLTFTINKNRGRYRR